LLWKREFEAPGEIMPTTMAVDDGRVCLQTVSHVICLDAFTGKEQWRTERPVARSRFSWSTPTLVIHDGVVLSLDRAASDHVDESPPARGSKWVMNSGEKERRQDAQLVTFALDDGKELWRAPYSENYNTPGDIFVIGDTVWVGNLRRGVDPGFTQGRDLKSGQITATIPPQKAWGHHRCYRNKATVRWLMVGRGGIQFIDPATGTVQANSWFRGTCQYGVMPANGLVYVPPHSCACQPEELLIGLNALSPQSADGEGPPPLEKGPAYDTVPPSSSNLLPSGDWPTYRGDVRRSGYQDLTAPRNLGIAWSTRLSPSITAPVVSDRMVFVAETDRHTLHALSAADGRPAWKFIADGRIDSPPTLCRGLCLFGTRNGFVYCLRAADGALVWRYRAAPQDRRLFAYEQIESVWPVHGSVLVDDNSRSHDSRSHARQSVESQGDRPPSGDGGATAYFAAGRSSRLDGGIRLYALEVETGKVLHRSDVKVPGGRGPDIIRQSVLSDILSIQKNTIWMRALGVDKTLAPVQRVRHLFAPRGFLDGSWWHRTYWLYGTAIGGGYSNWPLAGNAVPAGRLLVFDGGPIIYGYGRMAYRIGDGHVHPEATRDYKLFAELLPPQPESSEDAAREEQRRRRAEQPSGRRQIKWAQSLPFIAQALVLARDALLVAGGPAFLLPAPPVLDGMALTDSGVFVAAIDGSVVCLRSLEKDTESVKAEKPDASERKRPNVLFK